MSCSRKLLRCILEILKNSKTMWKLELCNTCLHRNRMGLLLGIVTARKRSLGQGNVFTPVCHSVHGRGVWLPSMHYRSYDWECLPGGRGESASGGGRCPTPPTLEIHGILWDTVNKRALRILLECILVEKLDFVKLNFLLVNINTEVLGGHLKISDHCL